MNKLRKPTKAIIAAAGFGTRFLPQTKAMPKEMLPIIDKPIIQYIVEDLVAAGIKDIIIVGSSTKRAIEDHFDIPNRDLLANLQAGGEKKAPLIKEIEKVANLANFVYLRQKGPYGTATPIMNASHLIGEEPFIYTYADDFFVAKPNTYQQIIECYLKYGGNVLSCMKIENQDDYSKYGILSGDFVDNGVLKMSGVIEKPGKENAPSNLASVVGFLFTPDILHYLEKGLIGLPETEEYYLTDRVIQPMIQEGHDFYGCQIQNGVRHDTGDKLEYLKTVVDFGLDHKDLGPEFKKYLLSRLK
jgi:UTP--glucose-1-phosphate uridylyltransferase